MKLAAGFTLICLVSLSIPSAATAQTAEVEEPIVRSGHFVPRGMMMAPGKLVPVPRTNISKVGAARGGGVLVLPEPDNSLWMRYYKAGETAHLKNDDKLATKYWMASLSELEKVKPNPADDFMSLKLSALESSLTYSAYPVDWTKVNEPNEEKLKHREEQVSTFLRMAEINRKLVPSDTLLCSKSHERYAVVKQDYEKALAESRSAESIPKP